MAIAVFLYVCPGARASKVMRRPTAKVGTSKSTPGRKKEREGGEWGQWK